MVHLPQARVLFGKAINITSMHYCSILPTKFLKISLRSNPGLRRCAIFGPKIAYLPVPSKKTFVKTINITFIYLLTPSSGQNFKTILRVDPLRGWGILGA